MPAIRPVKAETLTELISRYEDAHAAWLSLDGEEADRFADEVYLAALHDLSMAPSARTLTEALEAAHFALSNMAYLEGGHSVQGVLRAALDFFRKFDAPKEDVVPTQAHKLAYRQWLEMEGRYLGMELFPDMPAKEAAFLVPANTGVDRIHHPHGAQQTLAASPSSRAAKVLSAVGIDLDEIQAIYDRDQREVATAAE